MPRFGIKSSFTHITLFPCRRASFNLTGYGYATAVSSSGTVVGAAFEPAWGSIVASTWLANGTIVKLSPDDPNPSVAVAVNDRVQSRVGPRFRAASITL